MNALRQVRQEKSRPEPSGHSNARNAQAVGEKAFQLMQQYNITPTPGSYQLWFAYVSGDNEDLRLDMDACVNGKGGPTDGLCAQLFDKYFGDSEEAALIHHTNGRVHGELEKLVKHLRKAENDTQKFGNALEGYSGSLEGVTDVESVRKLINDLADEARTMETKSRTLEGRLKESRDEIDKLKRNLEAVRAEAATDALTGVGNRKQFEHLLTEFTREARDKSSRLSLIFGDVDHFKNFNDTWGHQLGDHVLKLVAHHLKTRIGKTGIATRYGGEEFAVLLPDVPVEKAVELAEDIRQSVCKKSMKSKATGVTLGKITMSFGVASFDASEEPADFVRRADHALYRAKNSGRNRVISELTPPDAEAC